MGAPVRHTCPDINTVIKYIRSAQSEASAGYEMNADQIGDIEATFKQIISDLEGIEDMLENLRDSNSSLRSWGESLEEQIDDLNNQIWELNESKEQ